MKKILSLLLVFTLIIVTVPLTSVKAASKVTVTAEVSVNEADARGDFYNLINELRTSDTYYKDGSSYVNVSGVTQFTYDYGLEDVAINALVGTSTKYECVTVDAESASEAFNSLFSEKDSDGRKLLLSSAYKYVGIGHIVLTNTNKYAVVFSETSLNTTSSGERVGTETFSFSVAVNSIKCSFDKTTYEANKNEWIEAPELTFTYNDIPVTVEDVWYDYKTENSSIIRVVQGKIAYADGTTKFNDDECHIYGAGYGTATLKVTAYISGSTKEASCKINVTGSVSDQIKWAKSLKAEVVACETKNITTVNMNTAKIENTNTSSLQVYIKPLGLPRRARYQIKVTSSNFKSVKLSNYAHNEYLTGSNYLLSGYICSWHDVKASKNKTIKYTVKVRTMIIGTVITRNKTGTNVGTIEILFVFLTSHLNLKIPKIVII